MARQADHADVEGKVFSSELGTDSDFASHGEEFIFQFDVAEGLAMLVSGTGQCVVVVSGGEFDGFEAIFR